MLKVAIITDGDGAVSAGLMRDGVRSILDATGTDYAAFYIDAREKFSLRVPTGDEPVELRDKFWESDLAIWVVAGGSELADLRPQDAGLRGYREWLWRNRILRDLPGPSFAIMGMDSTRTPWDNLPRETRDTDPLLGLDLRGRVSVAVAGDHPTFSALQGAGINTELLVNPAFMAGLRQRPGCVRPSRFVVSLSSRNEAGPAGDADIVWLSILPAVLAGLRAFEPLLFAARNPSDVEFLRSFCQPGERVVETFDSDAFLDLASRASALISDSPIASTAVAGMGVPTIMLGADNGARLIPLALPSHSHRDIDLDRFLSDVLNLTQDQESYRQRMSELRSRTLHGYLELVGPLLVPASGKRDVPLDALAPIVQFDSGWLDPERSEAGVWRWSSGDASIRVHTHRAGTYQLGGEWCGIRPSETLHVHAPDGRSSTVTIAGSGFHPVSSALISLPKGPSIIRLTALEAPIRSQADPRPLSFAWRNPKLLEVN